MIQYVTLPTILLTHTNDNTVNHLQLITNITYLQYWLLSPMTVIILYLHY